MHSDLSDFSQWRKLVQLELDKGRSITAIARDIGYARASLSLVLSGKYVGNPQRMYKKIVQVFGQVTCPYLGKSISPSACETYSEREAPTHNPSEIKHWRVCQNCPKRCGNRRRIM